MSLAYKNLTIVGTSHIARQSINEVRQEIEKKPFIVAVEIDRNRLMTGRKGPRTSSRIRLKDIYRIGLTGFIFAIIGSWAQKKLGSIVGVEPGAEMFTAADLTREKGINLSLIDQDISITLAKLSRAVTLKEKLRFPYDAIKAIIFRNSEIKRLGIRDLDLSKVPSRKVIKILTEDLKRNYPNVYNVLVAERNRFMANRLYNILLQHPKESILAVVGAGHEEEILGLVKGMDTKDNIIYEFRVS